jgi:hypothetical protein
MLYEKEQKPKEFIICKDCNEKLEYNGNWGEEHLKKFPDHRRYRLIEVT